MACSVHHFIHYIVFFYNDIALHMNILLKALLLLLLSLLLLLEG